MSRWKRLTWNEICGNIDELDYSGCYAIFTTGCIWTSGEDYCTKVLAYIGYSTNLKNRLNQYQLWQKENERIHVNWGYFDDIEIAIRPDKNKYEGTTMELKLINRLHPICNKMKTVWKKMESCTCPQGE